MMIGRCFLEVTFDKVSLIVLMSREIEFEVGGAPSSSDIWRRNSSTLPDVATTGMMVY